VEPQRAIEQAHPVLVERPGLTAAAAASTSRDDTPRAAFALLSWRINLVVVIMLVALSVIAWRSTIADANAMRAMVMGLGQIGSRFQGTMSAAALLAMWTTMMAAMMLPTVAPIVLAHLAVTRGRGGGVLPTAAFVGGYLLVWSAIGVVPMLAYWGFAQLDDDAGQARWLHVLAGAILAVAGVYQFTSLKRRCLDGCQSPLAFVVSHDFGGGVGGALRAGAAHGLYCVGCCWAVMAVLVVVGLMNILWMAGMVVLFFAEKHWKHGLALAKVAGAALVVLGVAVMAWPGILTLISR
jgi:predicted metal-binding membrane protein